MTTTEIEALRRRIWQWVNDERGAYPQLVADCYRRASHEGIAAANEKYAVVVAAVLGVTTEQAQEALRF